MNEPENNEDEEEEEDKVQEVQDPEVSGLRNRKKTEKKEV